MTPGTSVLPTKIGKDEDDDTGVLGGKNSGVLPRDRPGPASRRRSLGLSFLLLLAGGALIVVPSRLNTERNRRH